MSPMKIARCWLLLVLSSLLTLAACSQTPSSEQRLRESMAALQDALEARDAGGIDERLAVDFIGPDGLDREGAQRLARMMFLRHRDVGARLGPIDVALQDSHATVRLTAALTGGSGRLLPDAVQVYDVETGWRDDGGEWRMTSARWTPQL